MSPLNKTLTTRKIQLIMADLDKLKTLSSITLTEYEDNEPVQLQVERLLERTIGRLVDINFHILKENFSISPQDYFHSFIEMSSKKMIDKDLAQDLAKSVGLRNILAHEYDSINHELVHSSMLKAIENVPKYLEQLQTNLK